MEKKTLYRYFGNCATEEERIQVLEWTKASPENLKEFCRERNIYNAILLSTDNIQRTKYDFRRHYRAQLLRIAAVGSAPTLPVATACKSWRTSAASIC